ncbi:MAG: hypothetical protein H6818_09245 [Phycisphaerales bacterium]|nr:hypothetical protein [Phycisphaerales bacterium]MCB9864898.1 hypothetical protein [Phycisphaerales bacterium]
MAGATDCPQCRTWCSPKRRTQQQLAGLKVWVCPGCGAILSRSPIAVFGRVLTITLFVVLAPVGIAAASASFNLSRDSELIVIVSLIGVLLGVGLLCKVLTPLLLTISLQPAAKFEFQHGHCRKCDYDLRGVRHGRCPECGTPCLDIVLAWRRREARQAEDIAGAPLAIAIDSSSQCDEIQAS